MTFKEDDVIIELKDNVLVFKGKLEKSDYSDVSAFVYEAEGKITADDLIIDIRELNFLNSSGIRVLATLFTKTGKKIKIQLNADIAWQKVGILPLTHIRGAGEITII